MILLRLPISYQLVIVFNINIDINYQNRLLSISIIRTSSYQFQYQFCYFCLSIFPYQCIERLWLKKATFKKESKHFMTVFEFPSSTHKMPKSKWWLIINRRLGGRVYEYIPTTSEGHLPRRQWRTRCNCGQGNFSHLKKHFIRH